MNHCMTIWTYRTQIFNRINFVAISDISYGHQVMNVYVAGPEISVRLLKYQTADNASRTIVAYAGPSSGAITLVGVHLNSANTPFRVLSHWYLVGTLEISWINDRSCKRPEDFHRRAVKRDIEGPGLPSIFERRIVGATPKDVDRAVRAYKTLDARPILA